MLIEQAMIFALGSLAALLAVLLFLPAFWARAIRLSVRRVAEQMPLSMAEITAENDGLRAEGAIVQRRLEQERDRARAAHTELRGASGRLIARIVDLEQTVEAQDLYAAGLLTSLDNAKREVVAVTATNAAVSKDHYDASGLLERAARNAEQLHYEVQRVRNVSDQRRIAIAALETRIEGLQAYLNQADARLREADRSLLRKDHELRAVMHANGDMSRSGSPDAARGAAAHEGAARRDDTISADAASSADAARFAQLEAQMRRFLGEHAAAEQHLTQRIETLRTDKFALESDLEAARRDRDIAQRELRLAQVAGGTMPGGDPEALALLRRSIVDVAADVVRLMGDRDGPSEVTQQNVLQLRRERAGGRDVNGKTEPPATTVNQAAAKLF